MVSQAVNWEFKNALNYVVNERTEISKTKFRTKPPIVNDQSDKKCQCEKSGLVFN